DVICAAKVARNLTLRKYLKSTFCKAEKNSLFFKFTCMACFIIQISDFGLQKSIYRVLFYNLLSYIFYFWEKYSYTMGGHHRKESNCLNCGAQVTHNFCSYCGQENTVHPESVGHIISHFFQDFTHFDSKFFTSMKNLFFKPGHLTKEYNLGRRKRFINPIRMYIFVSLVVFSYLFFETKKTENIRLDLDNTETSVLDQNKIKFSIGGKPVTPHSWKQDIDSTIIKYSPLAGDGYFTKKTKSLLVSSLSRFKAEPDAFISNFLTNFMHNLPKTLLICLPFFALLLYLLYFNNRNYFVEHIIFSIHFHIFLLLLFLLTMLLLKIDFLEVPVILIFPLVVLIYLYKSLGNVYKGSKLTTIMKEMVLVMLYLVILYSVQILNVLFSLSGSHI
ncbi:MAG TPA: DUF3667 domain-containing protein, partial [Saprospiraceae bacterium]|nr:DUF3667 domain-containing protein [Saprospiraceae bacterium]